MTGTPINLRRARKARARAAARARADETAAAHGVPKTLRRAGEAERDRAGRALDGTRIVRDDDDG